MSPDPYEILPGALFISDAHFSRRRPQLLPFLHSVADGSLRTSQLILMGDIFDLLFGQIEVTHTMNAPALMLLKEISRMIPVLYLEGNHDYNLSALFPSAVVVPLSAQPFACRFGKTEIVLAHGDFNQPLSYRVYSTLIRHWAVLGVLDRINRLSGNGIIRRLERYLEQKEECYVIEEFEALVRRHLSGIALPKNAVFIEGHYHQGKRYTFADVHYINLDAFACNRHYAVVREAEEFQLDIRTFGEEV